MSIARSAPAFLSPPAFSDNQRDASIDDHCASAANAPPVRLDQVESYTTAPSPGTHIRSAYRRLLAERKLAAYENGGSEALDR